MQAEFPEIVKIKSIGKSWEGRDINMLEIDARDHYGVSGESQSKLFEAPKVEEAPKDAP